MKNDLKSGFEPRIAAVTSKLGVGALSSMSGFVVQLHVMPFWNFESCFFPNVLRIFSLIFFMRSEFYLHTIVPRVFKDLSFGSI